MKKYALATFVKTPGLTPAKTRLGAEIGQEKAEAFYLKSILATKKLFTDISKAQLDVDIYWSITEPEGTHHDIWKDYPSVSQGSGGLADRISLVFNALKSKGYTGVFLFGSDSPHVNLNTFSNAVEKLNQHSSVLGKTEDGGYYLLGSTADINIVDWSSISYSTSTTGDETALMLKKKGTLFELPLTFDIDYKEDLDRLIALDPQFRV